MLGIKFNLGRFIRFCLVGGIGAVETFGITWLLTEKAHIWYMLSMVFAVAVATVSNFILNSMWTFGVKHSSSDPDYEWNAYYKGNFIQKYWKHNLVQKVKNIIDATPESKVFDCGCGSSPLAVELGIKGYFGVDGNEAKIAYMEKKGLPFNYVHWNFGKNKLNSLVKNGYDVAMSIEVIEHMPDMDKARELVGLLNESVKSGGQVIIATPDYSKFLWRFVERVYGILMPSAYADDHKVKFDEESLVNMCSEFGLRHETTQYVAGCDLVCSFRKE